MIENYEFSKFLNRGSQSEVKLCEQVSTGRFFAMKEPLPGKHRSEEKRNIESFKKEIVILNNIKHPNIIKLVDFDFQEKNKTFSVIEYCPNGDLFDIISSTGKFTEDLGRFYFYQLLKALDACHQRKVYHCDIKLENLLLDESYNLKLCDFGLSLIMAGENKKNTKIVGTSNYMAPEMYSGNLDLVSEKSDLWSAAVALFVMVTGFPPFNLPCEKDWYFAQLDDDENPKFWNYFSKYSTFSPEFKSLMNGMFRKDPADRFNLLDIFSHPWMLMLNTTPSDAQEQLSYRRLKTLSLQ